MSYRGRRCGAREQSTGRAEAEEQRGRGRERERERERKAFTWGIILGVSNARVMEKNTSSIIRG